MDWLQTIIYLLPTITTLVVLVVKLVQAVQKAIKEKNWNQLVDMVMSYMVEAEEKFSDGATRKEWVMAMIRNSAELVNYDINMDEVSILIDKLSAMSKKVNVEESSGSSEVTSSEATATSQEQVSSSAVATPTAAKA
jgi:hypothetical protein